MNVNWHNAEMHGSQSCKITSRRYSSILGLLSHAYFMNAVEFLSKT